MSIMIIPGERMEDELLYSYIVRLDVRPHVNGGRQRTVCGRPPDAGQVSVRQERHSGFCCSGLPERNPY